MRMLHLNWMLLSLLIISSVTAQGQRPLEERYQVREGTSVEEDTDPNENPVLYWNKVIQDVQGADFDPAVLPVPDQNGGTLVPRAIAIVHLAIFDAVNAIDGSYTPYLLEPSEDYQGASIEAAVHQAALLTLSNLFPSHTRNFQERFIAAVASLPDGPSKYRGLNVGSQAAINIIRDRENDGAYDPVEYIPFDLPGIHAADPNNPDQGYVTPGFGMIKPFTLDQFDAGGTRSFRLPPPPTVFSEEYAEAYNEIKDKGADGIINPTTRTIEELYTGITWAYDGFPRIGTPTRGYMQAARTVAIQQNLSTVESARFFGLIGVAEADAAIVAWDSKYYYRHWRAVRGIRNGHRDGNPLTEVDEDWSPHGVPQSNVARPTPPWTAAFPSYPSGHSVIGGATFKMLENYFGTDEMPFEFVSHELDGVVRDAEFGIRPLVVRSFQRFSEAAEDSLLSRIYLGVHWRFDMFPGNAAGIRVSDFIYANFFRSREAGSTGSESLESEVIEVEIVEAEISEL